MKNKRFNALAGAILAVTAGLGWSSPASAQSDPLPSWNDTPTKQSIVEFVGRVTKAGGPDFVAPAERIATFDNDGTLWVEQPMYVQMAFALDRVKALAPLHRLPRSAIPTAISRFCSGRPSAAAYASVSSFITLTPSANMPTTGNRISVVSMSPWTLLLSIDGRWWT
jgi:hypothetical protein